MMETIRRLLDQHGQLPVKADTLSPGQNLYALGLTSFAAVELMIAIETTFKITFPERMLNRRSFASLYAIQACVEELGKHARAA